MAGLTSVLPNPVYVGDLDAGENTCGYVFRSGDQLVASLWTIQGDDGPLVRFRAEQLRDFLGNKIESPVRLSMAPVYAVGLDKSDVWYEQTAYSLETPHVVPAAAGDPVRPVVRVANNRSGPIACQIRLALPEGWKAEIAPASLRLAPGEARDVELPFTVALGEEAVAGALPIVAVKTARAS